MCLLAAEGTLASPEGANWLQSDSSGPPDHWPSAGDSCLLGSQDGDTEGQSLSSIIPFFLLETVITGDLLASKGGEAGERSWLQHPAYNSSVWSRVLTGLFLA